VIYSTTILHNNIVHNYATLHKHLHTFTNTTVHNSTKLYKTLQNMFILTNILSYTQLLQTQQTYSTFPNSQDLDKTKTTPYHSTAFYGTNATNTSQTKKLPHSATLYKNKYYETLHHARHSTNCTKPYTSLQHFTTRHNIQKSTTLYNCLQNFTQLYSIFQQCTQPYTTLQTSTNLHDTFTHKQISTILLQHS